MFILEGHTGTVYALAFSPDGRFLASAGKDGKVLLWDEGYEPRDGLPKVEAIVNGVAFDADGSCLIAGGEFGWTGRRNFLDEHSESLTIAAPGAMITELRFLTPTMLVLGHGHRAKPDPGSLTLWDLGVGKAREPQFSAGQGVRAVDVHSATKQFAWTEWGRRLTVRHLNKSDPIRFNLAHHGLSVAFHPDGEAVAVAVEWGAKGFDLTRKQERMSVTGHKGTVTSVAFTPDGRKLLTGSWDGTVRVWDWPTGAERTCFRWPIGKVFALAVSSDGMRFAAGGDSGAIALWDSD